MLVELGCIALGVPVGHVFRHCPRVVRGADRALTWLVWLLLFLLGLTIGYDAELMRRLDTLGGRALLIWACTLGATLLAARLLNLWLKLGARPPCPAGDKAPDASAPGRAQDAPAPFGRKCLAALRTLSASLVVLVIFCAGVGCGWFALLPAALTHGAAVMGTLYVQLFAAGMCLGFSLGSLRVLVELRVKALLVPVAVCAGALAGGGAAWVLLGDMPLRDTLAVSGGFSYYSLSSVLLSRAVDPALGSVSLLANMARELSTLMLAPLFQRLGGPLGPLSCGGAAAMDSCLPVIARASGERAAILGMFSGVSLTLFMPVWVSFLYAW